MSNLQIQNAVTDGFVPSEAMFGAWVDAVLAAHATHSKDEITLRVVEDEEIQALNMTYRHKNTTTNVLSFPFEMPEGIEGIPPILGDIAICAAVVNEEARQQNKEPIAHWAHMTVHGLLHLLGYDHLDDGEAKAMEQFEVDILKGLSIANPYEVVKG